MVCFAALNTPCLRGDAGRSYESIDVPGNVVAVLVNVVVVHAFHLARIPGSVNMRAGHFSPSAMRNR
jgi:hypothetical protein